MIALTFALGLPLAFAAASDGTDRCFDRSISNGHPVMIYRGDRKCHDFSTSVTVSGLWVDEFEGQRLIPQGRTLEDAERVRRDVRSRRIWFSTDDETRWDAPAPKRGGGGSQIYRIRVTGRYALKADPAAHGGFGHFGASDGLFLADRVVSVERLGAAGR